MISWESSGLIHAHSANSSVTQKNRQVVARRMIGPDWMRQISVMRFHDVVFFLRSLCQMSHDRPVRMHQIVSVAVNRSWLTGAYLLAFWMLRAMVLLPVVWELIVWRRARLVFRQQCWPNI